MKILQVVHFFLPRHMAGTEIYTFNLTRALRERGHEVWIYTKEEGTAGRAYTETDEYYEGIPVRSIIVNRTERQSGGLLNAFMRSFTNPRIDAAFDRLLQELQPDLVHFQHTDGLSSSMITVAKRHRLPVLFTLHDYWYLCHRTQLIKSNLEMCDGPGSGAKCASCIQHPLVTDSPWEKGLRLIGRLAGMYRTRFMRRILLKADVLIAPSEFLRQRFIAHGVPPGKIVLLPYGIPLDLFKDFQKRPAERVRIGFIGSIVVHKGLHFLIEAFRRLEAENAELLIYGKPAALLDYFEQVKGATGRNIKFMGGFHNYAIAEILAGLDVLVVPSIWPENSPLTIHEALAARVPVVAPRVGGIPALVEDGRNGFLFEVGSVDDLTATLHRIVSQPSLIELLREPLTAVKSIQQNAAEIEQIYLSLLHRSAKSHRIAREQGRVSKR